MCGCRKGRGKCNVGGNGAQSSGGDNVLLLFPTSPLNRSPTAVGIQYVITDSCLFTYWTVSRFSSVEPPICSSSLGAASHAILPGYRPPAGTVHEITSVRSPLNMYGMVAMFDIPTTLQ